MLKKPSEMSIEELRDEAERIWARREAKKRALTPAQLEKRRAYGRAYRVRQREVIERYDSARGKVGLGPKAGEPTAPKPVTKTPPKK